MEVEGSLTYNVVSILITNQSRQGGLPFRVGTGEHANDMLALAWFAKVDTLFDDIAGELVLRMQVEVRDDDGDHRRTVLLFAMLDDMLNHVIPKLVGDELGRAGMQLGKNLLPIHPFAVFEHPLDDSASIRMGGELLHVPDEGIDDEAYML